MVRRSGESVREGDGVRVLIVGAGIAGLALARALRLRIGARGDAAHEACGGGSGEDLPAVQFDGHLSSPWPNASLYREAVPLFVSVTDAADFASRISAVRLSTGATPSVARTLTGRQGSSATQRSSPSTTERDTTPVR